MKKLWNLTDFSELEEQVLVPGPAVPSQKKLRRSGAWTGLISLGVGAAILMAPVWHAPVNVPTQRVVNVRLEDSVTSYGPLQEAPLAHFFGDRLSADFTAENEGVLLQRLAEFGGAACDKTAQIEQIAETLFYNQHENVSNPGHAVSRAEIVALVKTKKLT
ncbi:MAG TPA: hypothetical protein VEH50_07200 [Methylomirabilota bacterium]|nr:hypothetical protein [Methylomirabilota bacterium]